MPPRLRSIATSCNLPSVQLCWRDVYRAAPSIRLFSATTPYETRQREELWSWLNSNGSNFLHPLPGSTNYLGAYDSKSGALLRLQDSKRENEDEKDGQTENLSDGQGGIPPERQSDFRPFPLNKAFMSESVTSEAIREQIWEMVMKNGQSVKEVSAELGIEMNRVGAIVRLKEVEKEWIKKGKPLAKPYAKAVMSMLPQTTPGSPHESINDLPVHAATQQQIFYPTSESRHFTREDAAKVFDENLLPADLRVPHPELAELERDRLSGINARDRKAKAAQMYEELSEKKMQIDSRNAAREMKATKIVSSPRWDFKFRDVKVEEAGPDGRGRHGTGWRYGVPLRDRKRGEVKIPTRVI